MDSLINRFSISLGIFNREQIIYCFLISTTEREFFPFQVIIVIIFRDEIFKRLSNLVLQEQ